MSRKIKIVGPYATNYSFARVNRGIAEALSKIDGNSVNLYQSREKIDKWPSEKDFETFPIIQSLMTSEDYESDVAIYNGYPKEGMVPHQLDQLNSKVKLMFLAWEETIYPKIWVDEINQNLDGVMVTSEFVRRIFRQNGVKVPIEVVLNGIDPNVAIPPSKKYPLKTSKRFKFLHVSSARKRKGVDVLLKAYFQTYTKDDDVCLVIKSFPGPDNLVEELLSELQTENSPEVEHIFNPDLTDQDLVNLMHSCDCAVYPTRTEGFGLPIAEAMYHELPVIVTGYSGHMDFVNSENAMLIDFEIQDALESEQVNLGAKWAEPSVKSLSKLMKQITEIKNLTNSTSELALDIKNKVKKAKRVADTLSWDNSAKVANSFINKIEEIHSLKDKKAGVISFFNNQDGISEYVREIYSKIENSFKEFYYISNTDIADRVVEDSENVVRIWESGEIEFDSVAKFVEDNSIDIVHIQYHSGFNFPVEGLDNLIVKLKKEGAEVYLTLHALRGKGFDISEEAKNLAICDKILIHAKADFEYLSSKLGNVEHFPFPIMNFAKRDKKMLKRSLDITASPVIASHGLLNSNKNILEIIKAVEKLKESYPNILFLGVNAVSSNNISAQGLLEQINTYISEHNLSENVRLITDFLSVGQIEILLQSSDINILAYSESGESASGAIEKCLPSGSPTITSDVKAFERFDAEVYKINEISAESISNAIVDLLSNEEKRSSIIKSANDFVAKYNYENVALVLLEIYSK